LRTRKRDEWRRKNTRGREYRMKRSRTKRKIKRILRQK
jgi:hypothetical protein